MQERIDGCCTLFPSSGATSFTNLQLVEAEDIWKRLDEWKRSRPKVWLLCAGIAQMQQGFRDKDQTRWQHALDNVWDWVPHFGRASPPKLLKKTDWKGAGWFYSSLMANLLQRAHFILWYPVQDESWFRPGLFCPTWEIAAYAVVGLDLLRQCPCGELFVPETVKQNYCTGAHREKYRIARWRDRRRREEKGRKPVA